MDDILTELGEMARRHGDLVRMDAVAARRADPVLAELKRLVHWHDQLTRADIEQAERVIAQAEGRS